MNKRLDNLIVLLFGFVALGGALGEASNDSSDECSAMNGGAASRLTVRPTIESRRECLQEVINFWVVAPLPDDVKPLVAEAREYYDRPEAVGSDYKVPEMSEGCKQLEQATICRLKEILPCWYDKHVNRAPNEGAALLDLLRTDTIEDEEVAYIKAIHEARYACKNGRFAGKAMRDDGVFVAYENWRNEPEIPQDSEGECLEKAVKFFEGLPPLPAELRANVREARRYYSDPEQPLGEYMKPIDTPACRELYRVNIAMKRIVPCFGYAHIVGPPTEALLSVFERSKVPMGIIEAMTVCDDGLYAGRELKKKGLLAAIDGWHIPQVTRDQCLEQAGNFLEAKMPLADDIRALIADASKYYQLGERIPGYRTPLPSASCNKLDNTLEVEFLEEVPCWAYEEVMGDDSEENWLELIKRRPVLREVKEAEFACLGGRNAGTLLNDEGLFDVIVGEKKLVSASYDDDDE